MSAYIERAVAGQAEADSLDTVLADIFATTGGEPTEEERAWARQQLGH